MRGFWLTACLAAAGFGATAAACHKAPTTPDAIEKGGQGRSGGPGQTSLARLQLAGPASFAPGETVRFIATAFYSDGSSRDVSSEAAWQSSDPRVLSLSPDGLASGHEPGEASVDVVFNG